MVQLLPARIRATACRWLPAATTLLIVLATMSPGSPAASAAEAPDPAVQAARWITRLKAIERELQRQPPGAERVRELLTEVGDARAFAAGCMTEAGARRKGLQADLETLGEPVPGESADVSRKRLEVRGRLQAAERLLADCKVVSLRSQELLDALTQRRARLLASRLLSRGPSLFALLAANWDQPGQWARATADFVVEHSGLGLMGPGRWLLLALVVALAAAGGYWLRRRFLPPLLAAAAHRELSARFLRAAAAGLLHEAPALIATWAAAGLMFAFLHAVRPVPFIAIVAWSLPLYFTASALLRVFLAPPPPVALPHDLPPEVARALARRLRMLALLLLVGFLFFYTLASQSLPEPAVLISRDLYGAFLVLNLGWALWLLTRLPRLRDMGWISYGMLLLLGVALAAEWAGFRNLASVILRGVAGSVLVVALFLLASRLFREFYDGLDHGRRPWQRSLRKAMGLRAGDPFPGLTWLRFLTSLGLWSGAGYLLLRIWGASETVMQQIRVYASEGFTVGSLHIVPSRILLGVVVIAVVVAAGGWFRGRLERHWLPRTRMDRGAREALVTMTGYAFMAMAVLLGLGVAGVEFGNLAIIAGALSVGIGFGLQNIVNNFVSGLILLFERPVKTGDWIVVGGTEGHVKRIRIRSTLIQTFDRADVIVPNSELISGQVTNWMLFDTEGRARIPVGVAYGTDTGRVRDLLEQVAREHPEVISDGSAPEPVVLFRAFGDSSLDFELRVFIRNIDRRLRVISDLNFAIDASFREHGIEIPFPQRDVHVRDWPAPPGAAGGG